MEIPMFVSSIRILIRKILHRLVKNKNAFTKKIWLSKFALSSSKQICQFLSLFFLLLTKEENKFYKNHFWNWYLSFLFYQLLTFRESITLTCQVEFLINNYRLQGHYFWKWILLFILDNHIFRLTTHKLLVCGWPKNENIKIKK